MTRAVKRTTEAEVKKADARVAATNLAAAKRFDKRVHRNNEMWRNRLARAKDEAREQGQAAGFASGQSAGYASGHSDGYGDSVDDGIDVASDELTCSDDLDVPLPFC